MPELPRGWVKASLDGLDLKIEAGLNVKCEERPPELHERGLVKISAVTWGRFDENASKTLSLDASVNERDRICTA
jgi:type I restriction enzyme, S subunit